MTKRGGKKLLVASLGVAAVSYAACIGTSGNLMPPPEPRRDAAVDATSDPPADGTLPRDAGTDESQ